MEYGILVDYRDCISITIAKTVMDYHHHPNFRNYVVCSVVEGETDPSVARFTKGGKNDVILQNIFGTSGVLLIDTYTVPIYFF